MVAKKYAIVLEGGGGKGGYQIGVWQALRELGIEIGAVAGTSVGALNAAFIVQDKYDEAYELWYNMNSQLVFTGDSKTYNDLVSFKIDLRDWERYTDYLVTTLKNRGLNIEPLYELILYHLDEKLIRESPIEFGLVTVSLTDKKAIEVFVDQIPEGEIANYLVGSSFLPMFKLSNGDDKKFLDGGFYDNLPVNMVYKRGYKDIITVEMKSLGLKKSLRAKDANIISIVPSGDVGTTLEFNQERSRNNMRMGYFDAMKAFGKYEGFDYFLEEVPEEDYFLNILLELDETQIAEMGREIGLTSGSSKRLLLERIIPEFARLFNLDQSASYKDIVVRFVELLAAAANIERLQSYTFRELRKEVFNIIENEHPGSLDFSKLPDFLKKSLLIKHSFKKNLVVNWAKIIVDRE